MSDLISRQATLDALCKVGCGSSFCEIPCDEVKAIEQLPFVDVEPIKHGRWIFSPDDAEGVCTRCNYKIYGRPYQNTYMIVPYNYCPNCGARMDEVEE